jgi:signal transduction histidine kinase
LLWWLPLALFVLFGLAGLRYLDRVVVREHRNEGAMQAVQIGALLEGFIRYRLASLHGLATLVADAQTPVEENRRFAILTREITASSSDLRAVYLLDSAGVVRAVEPARGERTTGIGNNHRAVPALAAALRRAAVERKPTFTGTVPFPDDERGVVTYQPIVRDGAVVGYVGGAFAYRTLFTDALAGQLPGAFDYRIRDDSGRVIAETPSYPRAASQTLVRPVQFPAGGRWKLEVAVERFQPLVPRLVTWVIGLLLLALVVVVIIREGARAERYAAHSRRLEILSRSLLDANVRLEERAQQVAEANRAKSRFLANVSHELRTPVNAIIGYNALALEGIYGSLSAPLRLAHDRINLAAMHLLGVVDDVLDLSKIEVGRMDVVVEPLDVAATLSAIASVVRPTAEAKTVRVDVATTPDLPSMTTDARHLRQIVLGLAANAVRFTEQGAVTISARRDDARPATHLVITIADTGIGIAAADLARIFEEFEQVRPDGRGDSLKRGAGLGLTVSRKLARLLGGEVRAESEVGAGSRFTVVLPIVTPTVVAPSPALDRPPAPDVERPIAVGQDIGPRQPPQPRTGLGASAGRDPAAESSVGPPNDEVSGLDDHPARG